MHLKAGQGPKGQGEKWKHGLGVEVVAALAVGVVFLAAAVAVAVAAAAAGGGGGVDRCHASGNRCLTGSNKEATRNKCHASSSSPNRLSVSPWAASSLWSKTQPWPFWT